MQLNLTPDDIDALVKQTILKSGVGKAIEEAITKALTGYNSPVDAAVKAVVQELLVRELQTGAWNEKIQTAVRAAIEARVSAETIDRIVTESINKIERAANDRY